MDNEGAKRRRLDWEAEVVDLEIVSGSSEGAEEEQLQHSQPLYTTQDFLSQESNSPTGSPTGSPTSNPITISLPPSPDADSQTISDVTQNKPREVSENQIGGQSSLSNASSVSQVNQTLTQSQPRVCGTCGQSICAFNETKWIACHNKCGVQCHLTCVGLTQRVKQLLMRSNSAKWICDSCVGKDERKSRPLINII